LGESGDYLVAAKKRNDDGLEHGEYGNLSKRVAFDITDHKQAKLIVRLKNERMTQAGFFRHIVNGYIDGDERILDYIEEVNKKKSAPRTEKTKKLRTAGKEAMNDLALNDGEIKNIFDLLAEEHPDL
jgi:hypothetical protein